MGVKPSFRGVLPGFPLDARRGSATPVASHPKPGGTAVMTTDWNEVLDKLLELMRLDLKIARLDQAMARAPAEVNNRAAAVAGLDERS